MRIAHLLPSGAESAAGLASAAAGLAAAQEQRGLQPQLLAADTFSRGRRTTGLMAAAQSSDLVHSHGLWLTPSAASCQLAKRGMPALIAPHGMLDPWAWRHHRWRKRLLWWLREQRTLQGARCLQALCAAERDAIRSLGIATPIALLPNGIALPDRSATARAALPPPPWAESIPQEARVMLFLGRFHAKKGLQPLLQAWAQRGPRRLAGAQLVLAGFGDGGALARQLRRQPIAGVHHLGALQGADKASALAHAHAFVLPSYSEGLPMAALEALSWGLPCLLSAACNLPEAFAAGAAWPAPPEPESLQVALQRWATASASELAAMGAAGRQLAAARFSWSTIAAQSAALYQWMLGGGSPPECLSP